MNGLSQIAPGAGEHPRALGRAPSPSLQETRSLHLHVSRARTLGQRAMPSPPQPNALASFLWVSWGVSHACAHSGASGGGGWAEGAHQGSFQACGIVVASPHDQKRPLCVELQGQVVDLLIQRQHLLDQL